MAPPRSTRGFPLFPLPIVALPGESVPLHVFEDRYRRMVERCLLAEPGSRGRQFGIVWLSEDELKPVGCACEVERVLERMPAAPPTSSGAARAAFGRWSPRVDCPNRPAPSGSSATGQDRRGAPRGAEGAGGLTGRP